MKLRLVPILLSLLFCAAGIIAWWHVQHSPDQAVPLTSNNDRGSASIPSAPVESAPARPLPKLLSAASYSHDDRSDEVKAYWQKISDQADHLIAEAADQPADAVASDEQALPLDTLPLLATAVDKPDLPAKSVSALHAALNADATRLKAALARQQTRQWYQSTASDIFKKSLNPPPSWTYPGTLAVDAAVRLWSADPLASPDDDMIVWRAGWSVGQTRCEEPLLLYISAQSLSQFASQYTPDITSAFRHAMEKMSASAYPSIRKLLAILRYMQYEALAGPAASHNTDKDNQLVDQCNTLFSQCLTDAQIPRHQWLDLFDIAGQTSLAVVKDRGAGLMSFFLDAAEKSSIDRSTLLTARGRFLIDYAWDARLSASGSSSHPSNSLFPQRLAAAAAALEEAWKLDPSNTDAAVAMMDVELGQGQGLDRLNLWFNRAINIDPSLFDAYSAKLRYLEPRWHGSIQQMLDFGHECASGSNWDTSIPLILVDAHLAAAHYTSGQWHPDVDPAYFRSNITAWNDVQNVYAQLFGRHPRNDYQRLRYAQLACWCQQWPQAQQVFDQVGDHFDPRVFPSRQDLQKAKNLVASHQLQTQPPN